MTSSRSGSWPPRAASPRLAAIDAARGLALCGMVAFHGDWDLAYGGWVDRSPAASPCWSLFGQAVASAFLVLSGYGLILGREGAVAAALVRIARILAVAMSITAVTLWLFPQDAITFGILHCIAVTNLLALPLRRAPAALLLVLAAICGLAPVFWSTPRLDGPLWWWLGLAPSSPRTLDYRPLLPWFGMVLVGMALAASPLPRPRWQPRRWFGRILAGLGRHSLLIYCAHQPVLFGLVMLAASLPGAPHPPRADVMRSCQAQCREAGAGIAGCIAACRCANAPPSPVGHGTDGDAGTSAICLPD